MGLFQQPRMRSLQTNPIDEGFSTARKGEWFFYLVCRLHAPNFETGAFQEPPREAPVPEPPGPRFKTPAASKPPSTGSVTPLM